MDTGKYYFDLGSECYDSQQYKQAVQWYDKALKEGYTNPLIYKNLGRALFKIGEYKDAIDYMKKTLGTNVYRQAVEKGYKDPFIYNNLGRALIELKKYHEAIDYLTTAKKHGYNNSTINGIIDKANDKLDNQKSETKD